MGQVMRASFALVFHSLTTDSNTGAEEVEKTSFQLSSKNDVKEIFQPIMYAVDICLITYGSITVKVVELTVLQCLLLIPSYFVSAYLCS